VKIEASKLNRRLRIERPVADESLNGAGSGSWQLVIEVWAEVQDTLPSRSERLSGGVNASAKPSRVRMRWRQGITPDMRFVMPGRVMQIVSGPAEVGRREGLEFMVEDYRPAGNGA
jgi:head-tail adaptor